MPEATSILSHLIEITLPSDLPFERPEFLLTVELNQQAQAGFNRRPFRAAATGAKGV